VVSSRGGLIHVPHPPIVQVGFVLDAKSLKSLLDDSEGILPVEVDARALNCRGAVNLKALTDGPRFVLRFV
jgi:hypothetical protein